MNAPRKTKILIGAGEDEDAAALRQLVNEAITQYKKVISGTGGAPLTVMAIKNAAVEVFNTLRELRELDPGNAYAQSPEFNHLIEIFNERANRKI